MLPVHLDSKGHMAWDEHLLAVGDSSLNLYSLANTSFTHLSSTPPKSSISCLEFSKTSEGILASGSSSGSVSFYKKSLLLSEPSKSFIKEDKIFDNVAVTNLQFCPSKQNLLAVGASDVFILNLEVGLTKQNPSQYVYKLGKNPMEGKVLTSLAWNPQVQYILAAASENCVATVWDLRNNQTLFNVHDSTYLNKSCCSALAWNPDIPTQFIMAYDDLTSPNLQIWDLRKHEQPVKELKTNHKTGVTALSWCPYDSSIFASSDRSGFTVLWNFKQASSFMKLEHSFEGSPTSIKWLPKHQGLVAFASQHGDIELRSLYTPVTTNDVKVTHSEDVSDLPRPEVVFTPKWVPKKVSATFGYNNKLVSFNQISNKIMLSEIKPKESEIKKKIEMANKLYIDGKLKDLSNYFTLNCEENIKLQWEIISTKLSGNNSGLLSILGFDRVSIEKATEKHTGKKRAGHEEDSSNKESHHDTFSFVDLSGVDAADFFDKAGAKHEEIKHQVEIRKSEPEFVQTISETISKNVNWDEGSERLIRENIILGNLESAIDCALMCGRNAEALIIAAQGGPDLFNSTREMVLSSSKDRYLRNSFLPLLTGNVTELLEKIDLEKWQEALTILIINNCKPHLFTEFGERLEKNNHHRPAQAFFLYAGNSDRVFNLWIKQFRDNVAKGESYEQAVFNLFFKALLYAESFKFFDSEVLESICHEYLSMLFKQSLNKEAIEIIPYLRSPKYCMSLIILIEKHLKANGATTKAPWKVMNIVPVKAKIPAKGKEAYLPEQVAQHKLSTFPPRPVTEPYKPLSKEATIPDPKKSAFPDPPKTIFQESEPKKSPFVNKDPFPSKEALGPEVKKSPFGDLQEPIKETRNNDPKNVAPPPRPAEKVNALPPPPKFKEVKKQDPTNLPVSPPAPKRQEPANIEPPPISKATEPPVAKLEQFRPEPVRETPILKQKGPQAEEVKAREIPPPTVPRVAPPPKIPNLLPNKSIAKAPSVSEGIDLSGMPSHLVSLAQKWESAIRDGSLANNPRILKDVESKMQEFFNKLKNQEFNDMTLNLIVELTEAFTNNDLVNVNKTHLELTNKTWNENGNWLTAMKRIFQAKQGARGK